MRKLYTVADGIHVLTDPGDLQELALDNCVVGRRKGQLHVCPLESLPGKTVEEGSGRWADPIFGYYDGKAEKFLIVDGKRLEASFCTLCKERLNGLTGNCFDPEVKPKGCAFLPVTNPGEFRISLEGWKYLAPVDVNKSSAFKKPYSGEYVSFEPKTLRLNRKAREVRADFQTFLKKKTRKYCSRCIWEGLCYMTSRRIAEHCMVTEEKTIKRSVGKIGKRFGSVEEFLGRLAYSGKEIVHRPRGKKKKTRWIVSKPLGRNHFLVRKLSRPWERARVSRRKVERKLAPEAIPGTHRERIAALAWFFMEKYFPKDQDAHRGYRGRTIRTLSILPVPEGIEVSYYPYGWRLTRRRATFVSFNEILRFER